MATIGSGFSDFTDHGTIRDTAVLTTGFVNATQINVPVGHNQLIVYATWVRGSLNFVDLKVDFGTDSGRLYQETIQTLDTSSPVIAKEIPMLHQTDTNTDTGTLRFAIPIKEPIVLISARGNGTVTNSLLSIKAITGVV